MVVASSVAVMVNGVKTAYFGVSPAQNQPGFQLSRQRARHRSGRRGRAGHDAAGGIAVLRAFRGARRDGKRIARAAKSDGQPGIGYFIRRRGDLRDTGYLAQVEFFHAVTQCVPADSQQHRGTGLVAAGLL